MCGVEFCRLYGECWLVLVYGVWFLVVWSIRRVECCLWFVSCVCVSGVDFVGSSFVIWEFFILMFVVYDLKYEFCMLWWGCYLFWYFFRLGNIRCVLLVLVVCFVFIFFFVY